MMARLEYAVAAQALDAESVVAVVLCVSMLLHLDLCWLYVPVIESTFLLLYVWALLHSGNALVMPWWRAECLSLYFGMV